jgi:hypothetical protein
LAECPPAGTEPLAFGFFLPKRLADSFSRKSLLVRQLRSGADASFAAGTPNA